MLATAPLPGQVLTTTYAGGNGLGSGGGVYFDLNVTASTLNITAFDVHVDQTGNAGSIDIFAFPTTAFGNESAGPGPWMQIGTGTATSNGPGVPTPVTLSSPIVLPPGPVGIAICYNGFGADYTNGAGTTPTDMFSAPGLDMICGTSTTPCLTGTGLNSSRIWNGSIYYNTTPGAAFTRTYGGGCGESAGSYYELFDTTNNTFDLGGAPGAEQAFQAIFIGSGYVLVPSAPAFFTPTSTPLALTDDSVVPQVLPFPLPLPDGTVTNDIVISSNGFIWLNGTETSSDLSESVNDLLTNAPRVAILWDDLNPADNTQPGSVHFDVDPSGSACYVTYLNVVEFGTAGATNGPNTVQLVISASGSFEWRFGTIGTMDTMVGFSLGNGALDPGSLDLSAVNGMPTGVDRGDATLTASGPPSFGTTINLVTGNIPSNARVGGTIFSYTQVNPGLSLGSAAPGCFQYLDASNASTVLFVPTGGATNTLPVPIPVGIQLGQQIYCQSALFVPRINPLRVITTNGLELVVGN